MGLTPTKPYEDLLADGIEALLGEGTTTLEGLVAGLNARNVHAPDGRRWTPELLAQELARLGA